MVRRYWLGGNAAKPAHIKVNEMSETITLVAIAAQLGITTGSARSLVSVQKIKIVSRVGNQRYYSRTEFDAYVNTRGKPKVVKGLSPVAVRSFLTMPLVARGGIEMAGLKKHPSKAQFDKVKAALSGRFGSCYFLIDGYLISGCIEQNGRKLCIGVYVNGWARGSDTWRGKESQLNEMPDIARKFFCLSRRGRSTAEIKRWEKAYGKKNCQKEHGWLYEKYCIAWFLFSTAGAFIAHLKKHNDSIEILTSEAYHEAISLQSEGGSDE